MSYIQQGGNNLNGNEMPMPLMAGEEVGSGSVPGFGMHVVEPRLGETPEAEQARFDRDREIGSSTLYFHGQPFRDPETGLVHGRKGSGFQGSASRDYSI